MTVFRYHIYCIFLLLVGGFSACDQQSTPTTAGSSNPHPEQINQDFSADQDVNPAERLVDSLIDSNHDSILLQLCYGTYYHHRGDYYLSFSNTEGPDDSAFCYVEERLKMGTAELVFIRIAFNPSQITSPRFFEESAFILLPQGKKWKICDAYLHKSIENHDEISVIVKEDSIQFLKRLISGNYSPGFYYEAAEISVIDHLKFKAAKLVLSLKNNNYATEQCMYATENSECNCVSDSGAFSYRYRRDLNALWIDYSSVNEFASDCAHPERKEVYRQKQITAMNGDTLVECFYEKKGPAMTDHEVDSIPYSTLKSIFLKR